MKKEFIINFLASCGVAISPKMFTLALKRYKEAEFSCEEFKKAFTYVRK